MHLILLRHGKAESLSLDGDFSRALVEKGREQARRAANLLKKAELLPEIVLSSPLVRARQTADEFCQTAGIPGPLIQGWLASGMPPDTALVELAAFRDFRRVAIVGHEPDLSRFIEMLLGAMGGGIEMRKGAIACVEITPPVLRGRLAFLIPPKLGFDLDG